MITKHQPKCEITFPYNYKHNKKTIKIYNSFLEQIEEMGRICYKSEDKITSDSAYKFVMNSINKKHWGVIEFGTIDIRIPAEMVDQMELDFEIWGGLYSIINESIWTKYHILNNGDMHLSTSLREIYATFKKPIYAFHNMKDIWTNIFHIDRSYSNEEILDAVIVGIEKYGMTIDLSDLKQDDIHFDQIRFFSYFVSNRVFTHEIIRHRLFGFLQQSQRYVSEDSNFNVIDPECYKVINESPTISNKLNDFFEMVSEMYDWMKDSGCSNQIARIALVNQCKTEIHIVGDLDYWYWVRLQRDANSADPMMQIMMDLQSNELIKFGVPLDAYHRNINYEDVVAQVVMDLQTNE